jgi:hypothetical protein
MHEPTYFELYTAGVIYAAAKVRRRRQGNQDASMTPAA